MQLCWAQSRLAPRHLRTENLENPIGIDEISPRLSWHPPSMQRAYQIRTDAWDSGRVDSSNCVGAPYLGPQLRSRDRVSWQVRVWDENDVGSDWSEPAFFEMGLLDASDWTAQWIAHPSWSFGQPMPVFRHLTTLPRAVRSARLYITGLGMYVAAINGRPVTTNVLAPGNTLYSKQVEYAAYDVTELLVPGPNEVRIELGNGMYNSVETPGRYFGLTNPRALEVKMIAQLEITFDDGTQRTIGSDASWESALGPTTASTWFGGEDYDARRETTSFIPAIVAGGPEGSPKLAWRPAPPVRVFESVKPVAISEPAPGVHVFDMGVNFAGWEQLRVSGPAGTRIVMKIGELLGKDGLVREDTVGGNIYDSYTLAGTGVETWRPKFAYHGFRYLQVSGLPAPPSPDTITGFVVRGANEVAGGFESSHALLNGIHDIINRAIQSNMISIFTDCPDREKLGWLGDMIGIFGSITRNFDIAAYARAVMQNMADAQTESGMVPTFAPAYKDYSIYGEGFRDDVNWGSAMILTPWALYETYGDARTMEIYYTRMRRYMAYLAGRAKGSLLDYGLGDWISPDATVPREIVATYGFHRCASTMARIAAAIGRVSDAEEYAMLARSVAFAFNAKYLDRGNRRYAQGQQAANAMALDMGIVPQDMQTAVLENLIANIRAEGNHVKVGIVALQAVLRALSAGAREDVIFDIATQTTAPSYGFQIVNGATSLTEEWSGPVVGSSQNHMMLGAIDEWFTTGLAGIRQAPGSVAFEEVIVKPAFLDGLQYVKGVYQTPRGLVESEWRRTPGELRLMVTIPGNTRASVHTPAGETVRLGPGTYAFVSP
ncbi:MAG: family 78 glycoside hydrolase catalytic domain [Candidatus Solibacter usitatus]|nr:family 78 glycoside hydrolase catalytic domain [Candidatus Solibacter usitatus]